MTNEHEQRLHEQLCAYVLGEATSEERAQIERELLRSPELRAQRDTIERTVGLVKTAMGPGESLSPEAAEALYSAASSSKPRARKVAGFLQLAAGIGAVALGFAIVRESAVEDCEVAELERSATAQIERRGLADERRDNAAPVLGDQALENRLAKDRAAMTPSMDQLRGFEVPATAPAREESVKLGLPNNPNVRLAEEDKLAKTDELVRRQRDLDAGLKNNGLDSNAPKQEAQLVDMDAFSDRSGDKEVEAKVEQVLTAEKSGSLGYSGKPAPPVVAGSGGGGVAGPVGPAMGGPSGPSAPATAPAPFHARKRMRAGRAGSATSSPIPTEPPALAGDLFWPGSNEKDKQAAGDDSKRELGSELWVASEEQGLRGEDGAESVPYYQLPPAEQQLYFERECRRIIDHCVRRPNEKPRDMYFRFWGDNPFEVTALDPQSTFAADVDTASYALARRYLNEGNVPEKVQIRTEEFVNYFKSDVLAPKSGVFAIHTDLAPSRFSTDTTRQMLRVVVRGKDLSKIERPRMNLTFVVDVSGSMREQMRLEMVKTAIRLLVTQLEPYDKIGIVKFSTDASVVLPLTNVSERALIETAIAPLEPDGSTNSNAGLELGYGMALGGLDKEATNRVVFLSDGVANVGETDPAKIAARVKPMREKGIYLNTIGVGMNNHNDVLLEQLANKADGMCTYIDTADEAKKQLVDNFSGAFQPIARDVKIQVEFDPTQVLRYRLLGYENRAIADADFRNDKVDAGELGAGHQVTALYEIERQGTPSNEKPLATVRLRWKEPRNFGQNAEADSATEITHAVAAERVATFEGAGQSYRKAVLAAQFAEILRRSVHARGDSLDALLNDAVKLQAEIPGDKDFTEFVTLVSKSKDLILRTMPACDELCQSIDEVREHYYRRAQIEQIQRDLDQNTLDELKRQNDVLEAKLRELVRRRLENRVR